MIHEHHQWLSDVNKSIVESFEREQPAARERGRAQETGHGVESNWDEALTDWLPPQYEIGKRKYLMLETEDGPSLTKETDLVVFRPHYPTKLRKKHHVLASGISAAFSVKRTVGREDITEAYEDAITLRRGMRIREGTEKAYLVPPVFYGLLGQSHNWKADNSTPPENVQAIANELERELVAAPREGLDLICIADLGAWTRKTFVSPQRFLDRQVRTTSVGVQLMGAVGEDSRVMSGLGRDYEQKNLSPVMNLIGALWDKLAINDPTLRPLADGLRITKTMDTKFRVETGDKMYTLSEVTTPEIAQRHRNSSPWGY
ncbi:DUF6602 domain-containing protein [Mycobacterium sp. SMC-4]|uniref:DUF6602 domain-containing protein n=1 Tax=Mycobacterium sp. SMC-4 TaxID=2857059 RepID=UPI0021B2CE3A|nr:DUF6602 domain-containing protein [Mycobacterium sp. SMC-4]UXA16738.1 hypothetical protein KXD98_18395 [Mycobacterium sp. SMC-4]